jgi:hypothetical protein
MLADICKQCQRNFTLDEKLYGGVVESPYMNHLPERQKNGFNALGLSPAYPESVLEYNSYSS